MTGMGDIRTRSPGFVRAVFACTLGGRSRALSKGTASRGFPRRRAMARVVVGSQTAGKTTRDDRSKSGGGRGMADEKEGTNCRKGGMAMRQALQMYLVLIGIAVLQTAYYMPRLPDPVASHFGGSGMADDWMSKDAFVGLFLGMFVVVAASLLLSVFIMGKVPDRWINLPHKSYWLAPERRDQTFADLTRGMTWFGVATMLFLMGLYHLAFEANLREPARLSGGFWILFAVFMAFTVVWWARLWLGYLRVPRQGGSGPRASAERQSAVTTGVGGEETTSRSS